MKRAGIFIAISVFLSIPSMSLLAHDTVELPAPGHIDFSTFWIPVGGKGFFLWWNENQNGAISQFGYHVVTPCYNPGASGIDSLMEIGILPGLALGLQINIPQAFLNLVQGGSFYIDSTLWAALDLVHSGRFKLQTLFQLQIAPIYGPSIREMPFDEGYFNLFFTLGASDRLYENHGDFVAAYLDAKARTTIENPAYRNPRGDFENMLGLVPGSTDGLPAQLGPIYNFALATGIEARFSWFIFYVGYNFPVIGFTQFQYTGPVGNTFFDLSNIEFSWRFRL